MPIQRVCHLMIGQQAAPAGDAFVFTVQTTGVDETLTLPLEASGSYDFAVDWGDTNSDNISAWDDAAKTHTYASAGTYEISITGTLTGFRFNNTGSKLKIREIKSWGILRLGNSNGYFYGCSNLTITATDVLNLTGTTTLENAFRSCESLTTVPSMNSWDVSSVISTQFMFYYATSFNQNIGSWNVSNVDDMTYMFFHASVFNQDIGSWDVSSVTTISSMFGGATLFDQDITGWTVTNVLSARSVFEDAIAFNQAIGSWNVSSFTTMNRMFKGALLFNQNLNSWDVSGVLDMERMFYQAAAFNGNISSWNVSNVVIFAQMFFQATAFNQDISDWVTTSITDIYKMFYEATSFDQNIGDWDVSSVIDMYQMLYGVTLSTSNYSSLLIGWESQSVQNDISFHGGSSKYSAGAAATARANLETDHNWSITDGGQA